ncbi:MAG: hypothetical protein ACYC35_04870 [Pirellulales bacterium]
MDVCRWLPQVLLIACLSMSGCAQRSPKDKNGDLPDDVVRKFVTLAQAEDYRGAQRLWYGESMLVFKPSDPQDEKVDLRMAFRAFCEQYRRIDLDSAAISKAYRGKSGFFMVDVDWREGGAKKHDQFGIKIVNGEWKMERGYYW